MVIGVELEDKTEEYKYSWHRFFFAKIGNKFITHNTFCKKCLRGIFALLIAGWRRFPAVAAQAP
jgi:hypothetical protein